MPVGILYGDADKVLDHRQQGLWMADRVPSIEIEIMDGIGHMPQFVVADRVAAFVRRIADHAFAA
jgi:pimeloyl-ACP methyl ester carboxylesterase